jgi:hypothetical protein
MYESNVFGSISSSTFISNHAEEHGGNRALTLLYT